MMSKVYSVDEIRRLATPIAQQYGVAKLALFGSYARGEQNANSDIDFIVDKGAIRGWEFFGFIDDLEKSLNTRVDVLTYNALRSSMIHDAIRDEVIIYEKS